MGLVGIGKDLAGKIETRLKTDDLPLRQELRGQVPAGLRDLITVPGVGPKGAQALPARRPGGAGRGQRAGAGAVPQAVQNEMTTMPAERASSSERRREKGARPMSTGLSAFASTLHTTHVWLNQLTELLGWPEEPHRAYLALRAVLHALRDRLSVDEAAALAAQLPMLVRGFYYEGWHPHGKPLKERKKEQFLAHVRADFRQDPDLDAEQVARAVFQLLSRHVAAGEVTKLKRTLPEEIRSLWPEEAPALTV